ncbi:MAG: endonuclease/exonuclease/phosphatase family protein [Phycisphaerales bacterium]|nr:endonuclease/exonuclease/phosphatase family protein [Phycisphaerales bacterium]
MRSMRYTIGRATLLLLVVGALPAVAQWNPSAGQWGRTEPTDFRIMTFNIRDGIRSTAEKSESYNAWQALARIVAAFRPDVLCMQEVGDLGNGVDSVATLTHVLSLFMYGGTDIYQNPAVPVTAYVQKYAPGYDLPHVYVSTVSDGFNRNVLLSRYPFVDLNGDTVAVRPRIYSVLIDPNVPWVPGGNDGIRGFINAEIDLPDTTYAGDMMVLTGHMKAGSTAADRQERLLAAQNIAYYIDYLLNGAGTGMPDPHNRINDSPQVASILPPDTPVVLCGDWNEDEATNNRRGPADWITRAELDGGTDGADRDRSDMTYDAAVEPRSGSRATFGDGSTKLDYVAWQDSIATLRRAFIFRSTALQNFPTWYPPEIAPYPNPQLPDPVTISPMASDHRPVIVDLVLPLVPAICPGDLNCDGVVDFNDIDRFVEALGYAGGVGWPYPDCPWLAGDASGDGQVTFDDIDPFVALIGTSCR